MATMTTMIMVGVVMMTMKIITTMMMTLAMIMMKIMMHHASNIISVGRVDAGVDVSQLVRCNQTCSIN